MRRCVSLAAAIAFAIPCAIVGLAQSQAQKTPEAAKAKSQAPASASVSDDGEVELSSNLVTVTLVVRDASGALVTNLDPKDFTVFEDNAPQEIDQIYRTAQVPLRLAFLFDASISIKDRLDFEKRAAARFFTDVIGASDQASLYSISTDWKREQALTSSSDTLNAALGRIDAGGITSLFGAIDGASKDIGAVEGRRVAVVLSDGYDTAGATTLEGALESAQRADVVIYGISPAGTGGDETPAARIGETALRRLAEQTGGVAFFPPVERDREREASALDQIYRRVADEIRAQSVLTFYSQAPHDGRFHALRVDCKRPGLSVAARKGYYAE